MNYYFFVSIIIITLLHNSLTAQCWEALYEGSVYQKTTLDALHPTVQALNQPSNYSALLPTLSSPLHGQAIPFTLSLRKFSPKKRQALLIALQQATPLHILQQQFGGQQQAPVLVEHKIEQTALGDTMHYYHTLESPSTVIAIPDSTKLLEQSKWVYKIANHKLQALYIPNQLTSQPLPSDLVQAYTYTNQVLQLQQAIYPTVEEPNFYCSYPFLNRQLAARPTYKDLSSVQQQVLLDSLVLINWEASCGADQVPGCYALLVATLAAQTNNLPLFVRAHLRGVDNYWMVYGLGYYLEDTLHTYYNGTKDLEYLQLDLAQLIKGLLVSSTAVDAGEQRYYLSLLCRALKDARERGRIFGEVLALVERKDLDVWHRVRAAEFCHVFLFELPPRPLLLPYLQQFKQAVKGLPAFLAARYDGYYPAIRTAVKADRRGRR